MIHTPFLLALLGNEDGTGSTGSVSFPAPPTGLRERAGHRVRNAAFYRTALVCLTFLARSRVAYAQVVSIAQIHAAVLCDIECVCEAQFCMS
jgi:hypothetical protein